MELSSKLWSELRNEKLVRDGNPPAHRESSQHARVFRAKAILPVLCEDASHAQGRITREQGIFVG